MNGLYSEKGTFYRLCEWGMRLAYVNVLWFFFTFVGMVVAGISPASVSLFTVMRKWLIGQEDIPVFQTFFSTYKKEFLQANAVGLVLAVFAGILFLDFWYMVHVSGIWQRIFSIVLFSTAIVYSIVFLYLFPTYVHYHLRLFQYIKHSFFIGIANPVITIGMIVSIASLWMLFVYIPAIVPFYGVSLCSFIAMKGALKSFQKIEKKLS